MREKRGRERAGAGEGLPDLSDCRDSWNSQQLSFWDSHSKLELLFRVSRAGVGCGEVLERMKPLLEHLISWCSNTWPEEVLERSNTWPEEVLEQVF